MIPVLYFQIDIEVLNVSKDWTIKDKPKSIIGIGSIKLNEWVPVLNKQYIDNCINLIIPNSKKQQGRLFASVELTTNTSNIPSQQPTAKETRSDMNASVEHGTTRIVNGVSNAVPEKQVQPDSVGMCTSTSTKF